MKRYILLNSNTLENEGVLVGSKHLWAILLFSLFFVGYVFMVCFLIQMKNTRLLKEKLELNESVYMKNVDSLQCSIDHLNTMVEDCNLHSFIGQLYIKRTNHTTCNKENIWNFIKTLNVWYPEYIMAQAIQESSCGKASPNGTNNLFGMTLPRNRETTAMNIGSSDRYAKYKNWELSVIDRVLWELYVFNYKKPTKKEYLEKLKTYAEDKQYVDKITKLSKNYKNK